jgi:hypothetical protein
MNLIEFNCTRKKKNKKNKPIQTAEYQQVSGPWARQALANQRLRFYDFALD